MEDQITANPQEGIDETNPNVPTQDHQQVEGVTEEVPKTSAPTDSEQSGGLSSNDEREQRTEGIAEVINAISTAAEVSRAELDAIKSEILASHRDISALRDAVSGSFKETTDRMHEKLQRYDRGLEASLRKPVIDEIIAICDEVEKNIRDVGEDAALALQRLRELPDFIKTSLYNLGIEEYSVESGVEKFNPRRHRGLKPVPTDDENLDGIVCEVYRTGFASDVGTDKERPFRTAWVSVYKKQQPENKED